MTLYYTFPFNPQVHVSLFTSKSKNLLIRGDSLKVVAQYTPYKIFIVGDPFQFISNVLIFSVP